MVADTDRVAIPAEHGRDDVVLPPPTAGGWLDGTTTCRWHRIASPPPPGVSAYTRVAPVGRSRTTLVRVVASRSTAPESISALALSSGNWAPGQSTRTLPSLVTPPLPWRRQLSKTSPRTAIDTTSRNWNRQVEKELRAICLIARRRRLPPYRRRSCSAFDRHSDRVAARTSGR